MHVWLFGHDSMTLFAHSNEHRWVQYYYYWQRNDIRVTSKCPSHENQSMFKPSPYTKDLHYSSAHSNEHKWVQYYYYYYWSRNDCRVSWKCPSHESSANQSMFKPSSIEEQSQPFLRSVSTTIKTTIPLTTPPPPSLLNSAVASIMSHTDHIKKCTHRPSKVTREGGRERGR